MKRLSFYIFVSLLGLILSACSWSTGLFIANTSDHPIYIRYAMPGDSTEEQFYKAPKTYPYDSKLLDKKNPDTISVPSDIRILSETEELEIKLAPRQVVHIGNYMSFQDRRQLIIQYEMKIVLNNGSTLYAKQIDELFQHTKSIHADVLEIK